ncbi:unnamed protein product [Staurois parvus]|uniref:Uncharacterized protein n=1 Tax=Staurois parvus TaxID=386267 RepID=A0ABN9E706_9NEOB|nr:unnamed protein product [Staurois parvus]
MISVAPAVPAVSAHQCLPMHINATYQCPSELPFSVAYQCHQCRLSVRISALSVLTISAMPVSAAFQCPSVMPVNAHQCHLLVPPHQCPSVQPISAHQ